jgi:hypothetical protein
MLGLVFVSLLVAAVLVWLLRAVPRGSAADPLDPADAIEPPDLDELEAAERELRDAEPGDTSKEIDERDWGPGAPR